MSTNVQGSKPEYHQRKREAVARAKKLAKTQAGVLKVFGANGELDELKDYGTLEPHKSSRQPSIASGFGGASGLIKFGPGFERDLDDMVDYV